MFARENEVRRPVVAGTFYPSEVQALESTVKAMLSQTAEAKVGRLCGVVVPHAGYPYSGPIAGKAFSLFAHATGAPNRILLIGPPHFMAVRGIVAPSSLAFATPLGRYRGRCRHGGASARCRSCHHRRHPAYARALA